MSASKSKWKRHKVAPLKGCDPYGDQEAVKESLCHGEGCKRFRRRDKVLSILEMINTEVRCLSIPTPYLML